MKMNGIVTAVIGYVGAGAAASLYYIGQADANDSGTVTQAEYDAAVEAGNPLITTLLGPAMIVGEEVFAMLDMIAESEPA